MTRVWRLHTGAAAAAHSSYPDSCIHFRVVFIDLLPGCEADAVAYTEDERRSLRTDDAHRGESKTVLPDGSYSTGPRLLRGLTRARVEHCLVCADFLF